MLCLVSSSNITASITSPGLKWLCGVAVEDHLRGNSLRRDLEEGDSEKVKMQEEMAAIELNYEDCKREAEHKEMELRRQFQV